MSLKWSYYSILLSNNSDTSQTASVSPGGPLANLLTVEQEKVKVSFIGNTYLPTAKTVKPTVIFCLA